MSLKLLIDKDSQDKLLVKLLRQASHDVITVNEAVLMGQSDSVVFNYAKKNHRILLTYNCDDFEALPEDDSIHSVILAIYRSSNPAKNMTFKDIIRVIANLELANFPFANQFISLNHWNY